MQNMSKVLNSVYMEETVKDPTNISEIKKNFQENFIELLKMAFPRPPNPSQMKIVCLSQTVNEVLSWFIFSRVLLYQTLD